MIRVENKELLFSREDSRIGAEGDNSTVVRSFRIPRVQNDGVDLANLTFKVDILYKDTNTSDIADLDKTVTDENIDLDWTISSTVSSHVGAIIVNLRAFDGAGELKWRSYKGVVYIEDVNGTITPSSEQLTELERLEASIDNVLSSEASRQEAEAQRQTAETARQETFDTNEADRQSTFETNETDRQSAAESSESSRAQVFAENEADREHDFTEALTEFNAAKTELQGYAKTAESYAKGGTGTRTGEGTDNAKYYSERASSDAVSAAASSTLAQEAAATASSLIGIVIPSFAVDFTTGNLLYTDYSTLDANVVFNIDTTTGNLNYTITT